MSTENRTSNSVFDIVKLILALMVAAIHASLFPEVLYPWLRIAVPLFFILSSYFLFLKVNASADKRSVIKRYIVRNLRLYAFYFILLLPYTIYVRDWFAEGVGKGLLLLLRDFFFASTFPASWYIMASVIAVVLISFASKYLSGRALCRITFLLYLLIAFRSAYYHLYFDKIPILSSAVNAYDQIFTPAYTSFPVALFWVAVGKRFAEARERTDGLFWRKAVLLVLSGAGLWLEWNFVRIKTGRLNYDCYLMLALFVPVLFDLIRSIPAKYYAAGPNLRKISTVIYTTHMPFLTVASALLRRMQIAYPLFCYTFAVCGCLVTSLLILHFEKKPYLRWLKYAH